MAVGSLSLTNAPITPKEVTLKFSKILVLVDVFKNGYKKRGICAIYRNKYHSKNVAWSDGEVQDIGADPLLNKFCWMKQA